MAVQLTSNFSSITACKFLRTGVQVFRFKGLFPCTSVKHHSTGVKYFADNRRKLLYRCSSTSIILNRTITNAEKTSIEDYIPVPPLPPVPQDTSEVTTQILSELEPSLTSQGLGGWSPIGLLQHFLDWLHVSVGIPWWATIVVTTLVARTLMFPLFVKSQKNAAVLHNNMPQIQTLQKKVTEARQNGNHLDVAKYTNELMTFMKEANCNPFKSMLLPLCQAPVFISFFIALRRMANLPVESFKHGGILWFTDLTITDQYYILPVITCVTLFITIELGAEGGLRMDQLQTARYVLRALPVIMFPFIINFPTAILCYWVTTNGITLMQVALLKHPKVREYLNIPIRMKHPQESLPMKKKGFVESIKDSWDTNKITREMADRVQKDHRNFQRAGIGPVPKTYKFDPTKQK